MVLNTFSIVAVVFAGLAGTAQATTVTTSASIYSHDAYARFLPGGFTAGINRPDDGFQASAAASILAQVDINPVTDSNAFKSLLPSGPSPSVFTDIVSDVEVGLTLVKTGPGSFGGGWNGTGLGGKGPGNSPTQVDTVPLPPTFGLFGTAILGLASFGYGLKRRTLRSA